MTPTVPEGTWKARGGQWALTKAESSGNVMIAVEIIIKEGPAADSRLTWYGHLTDKTFERTVESLRLLGWKGDDLSDLTGVDSNDVNVVIGYEPDLQGEIRARVQWINQIGGVVVSNRLNPSEAAIFAQRMKGRVHALKQASGSTQQQRPTGAQLSTPDTSDDIPF
jgi:hypothetical protein